MRTSKPLNKATTHEKDASVTGVVNLPLTEANGAHTEISIPNAPRRASEKIKEMAREAIAEHEAGRTEPFPE